MIGICQRCKKEAYIYNPKQEIKMCHSCYNYFHRNKEKERIKNKKWQKNNISYFRNYYQKNKEKIKKRRKIEIKKQNKNENETTNTNMS